MNNGNTEIYLLKADPFWILLLEAKWEVSKLDLSILTPSCARRGVLVLRPVQGSRPATFWSEVRFPRPPLPRTSKESQWYSDVSGCSWPSWRHRLLQQHMSFLLNNASSHQRSPPSSALLLGYSGKPCSCEAHVEETGNACHSRAALYPMGDNGRRAERQGCARGHVPHQHIAPLSGQEAAFPVMSPSSSSLCDSALALLLQTHTGKVKPGER